MKVIFKERIQINGKGDVDYTRQERKGGVVTEKDITWSMECTHTHVQGQ